jgi:hypothetical protein
MTLNKIEDDVALRVIRPEGPPFNSHVRQGVAKFARTIREAQWAGTETNVRLSVMERIGLAISEGRGVAPAALSGGFGKEFHALTDVAIE